MRMNDASAPSLLNRNGVNEVKFDANFLDPHTVENPVQPPDRGFFSYQSFYGGNPEASHHEDCDFSDVVLCYINQMLMEEDMEDKTCLFQESAALLAEEKSFYDVLGEKYPPSAEKKQPIYSDHSDESRVAVYSDYDSNDCGSGGCSSLASGWVCGFADYGVPSSVSGSVDLATQATPQSCLSSITSSSVFVDGLADSPVSTLGVADIFTDGQSALLMKRGFEEASKFLPNGNALFADMGQKKNNESMAVKIEKKHENKQSHVASRGKKNHCREDEDSEDGRSNKQSAVYGESNVSTQMFDMVLLCSGGKHDSAIRESFQNGSSKGIPHTSNSKGSSGGKTRGKKQAGKKDVVDLRTLLTLCAQAVAANDQRNASELLKQIRQHSSQTGDGMQRLAYYFACGLEARLASSGTQVYNTLISLPASAADVLKAYHIFIATSPFRKMANFFSNKTIITVAENATRLHIIDFGILYGFQWPCLIQRLSESRPGGPPKLRITGIDFPNPGFRPSQRVEETGRRLANYAKTFGVPFEFHAIAQKWETIKLEDLNIDRDELVVVNSLFRLKNLLDETVVVDSPRNKVMHLIRHINPHIFIQGVTNGSYNAPFFITRFREALFHFSSLFDMLEANVPRDVNERMLLEKMIFGQEAMNVIACEGAERMERPETYKQWQVRILRCGFKQLPLDRHIINKAKERVKSCYHKDFIIDEDGWWMVQGWKGRIVYALSTWTPAD